MDHRENNVRTLAGKRILIFTERPETVARFSSLLDCLDAKFNFLDSSIDCIDLLSHNPHAVDLVILDATSKSLTVDRLDFNSIPFAGISCPLITLLSSADAHCEAQWMAAGVDALLTSRMQNEEIGKRLIKWVGNEMPNRSFSRPVPQAQAAEEETPQSWRPEDANRILLSAFEQSPDALVLTNVHGSIDFVNQAASELDTRLGQSPMPGKSALIFQSSRVDPNFIHRLKRTVANGRRFSERVLLRGDSESPTERQAVWLEVVASPLFDDQEAVSSILISKKDVTQLVRSEKAARIRIEANETIARMTQILIGEKPLSLRLQDSLQVASKLEELFSIRMAAVLLREDQSNQLQVQARVGTADDCFGSLEQTQRRIEELLRDCFAKRDVVISDHENCSLGVVADFCHRHYAVPLIDQREIVGILLLSVDQSIIEVSERLAVLHRIGDTLARAVARSQALDRVERSSGEVKRLANRLAIATQGANVGIWDLDLRTGELIWDDTMFDLYGMSKTDKPTYNKWTHAIHIHDRLRAEQELQAALSGRSDLNTEFRIVRPNGEVRYLRTTATLSVDQHGSVCRATGANWDVSDTAIALNKLNESQRVANLGSWTLDVQTGTLEFSDQLFQLLKPIRFDDTIPLNQFLDCLCETSAQDLIHAIESARSDGEPFTLTVQTREQINGANYLSIEGRIRRDTLGSIVSLYGTAMEVSTSVQREQTMREITKALDSVHDCVFMFEADTLLFAYANQGASLQVGYSKEELSTMTPVDFKPDFDQNSFEAFLTTVRNDPGSPTVFRTEHQHRNGNRIPVEISLQYLPELGVSGRFVAVVRDISEQLKSEKMLRDSKESAEAANLAKSEFLANMSHEIRTPMTAILGFTDLIAGERGVDPTQLSAAVGSIQANAHHLLTIINDILDVSKIEAGQMTIENIKTNPIQILREVVELVEPRAQGKGISINVLFESPIPDTINSDPTRLKQIILNLVGNAIKFTEVGGVTIHASCNPQQEKLQVDVVDTGIGMSEDQREQIARFGAFTQADASMSRRFGGTGLGLRISNGLAEMLGGGIQIESVFEQGSRFSLQIATGPLEQANFYAPEQLQNKPQPAKHFVGSRVSPSKSLDGIRVLVAEDGPDNQRLIRFMLEKAGAKLWVCENGKIAIETLEQLSESSKPHVILMDMQMPVMDGYTATVKLREMNCQIPIIALTAHAMSGDRNRCLAAGCDDYQTKPFDRSALISAVEKWGKTHASNLDGQEARLEVHR